MTSYGHYVTVFILEHSDFGINDSQSLQSSRSFAASAASAASTVNATVLQ